MNKKFFIAFSALFLVLASLSANPAEHLDNALKAEQSALSADSADEAVQYRATAIQAYETARGEGLTNGALYGKLGVLYLQQNDLGHAILNLKKALLFAPHDRVVKANLALARNRRMDHFVEEENTTGAVKALAFFHYDIGYPTRVNLALASWALLAALAILLLWKRPLWLATLAVICGLTSALFTTSAAITAYTQKHNKIAVVSAPETMPRKGDGEAYTPATNAPLHAGTEVTVKRHRGDWAYVILPGNIPAWLNTKDLAE